MAIIKFGLIRREECTTEAQDGRRRHGSIDRLASVTRVYLSCAMPARESYDVLQCLWATAEHFPRFCGVTSTETCTKCIVDRIALRDLTKRFLHISQSGLLSLWGLSALCTLGDTPTGFGPRRPARETRCSTRVQCRLGWLAGSGWTLVPPSISLSRPPPSHILRP